MSGEALMPALDVAAGLLVLAGAAKLRRPESARATLRAVGLPSTRGTVRAAGAMELALGLACIVRPATTLQLGVALVYLVFAGVAATLVVTNAELESCGCLGERDAPPSWVHIGFDLAAAAVAFAAATRPEASIATLAAAHPGAGLVLGAGIAAGVALSSSVLTALPAALSAYPGDGA